MNILKRALLLICAIALGGGALFLATKSETIGNRIGLSPQISAYSKESFYIWLRLDAPRQAQFVEFEEFLGANGVGNIVPVWQLTRTDTNPARKCERPEFHIPEREKWPNILPALKIARDHIVPEIGPLEVLSSFRTLDFNECIGGSSRSQHLGFYAVDLRPVDHPNRHELYEALCAIHQDIGAQTDFGLGAYFDPQAPEKGLGSFHIDGRGYRSWGFDYTSKTSACRLLN